MPKSDVTQIIPNLIWARSELTNRARKLEGILQKSKSKNLYGSSIEEMIADYFTKPLQGSLFRWFCNAVLGMTDSEYLQYKDDYYMKKAIKSNKEGITWFTYITGVATITITTITGWFRRSVLEISRISRQYADTSKTSFNLNYGNQVIWLVSKHMLTKLEVRLCSRFQYPKRARVY